MEDIVEKSSTGGLDVVYGPDDENNAQNEIKSPADLEDENLQTPVKKGKKLNGVNSGQLDSKTDEEDTEMATDEVKQRSSITQKNNFNTLQVSLNNTMAESDEKMRFDRMGNQITTVIGKFQVGSMRKSMKSSTRKSLQTSSDTGAADLASPEKKDKQQRHRVTFMDDVSGDKGQLVEIHLIESYKKFNQDSYMENQNPGCCTIF